MIPHNSATTEVLVYKALLAMEAEDAEPKDLMLAGFTIALRMSEAVLEHQESLRPIAVQAAQVLLLNLANKGAPS